MSEPIEKHPVQTNPEGKPLSNLCIQHFVEDCPECLRAVRRNFTGTFTGSEPVAQQTSPQGVDDYVAWLRYAQGPGDSKRIVVCDSDEPGAFKVYRAPHARELLQARLDQLKDLSHYWHAYDYRCHIDSTVADLERQLAELDSK